MLVGSIKEFDAVRALGLGRAEFSTSLSKYSTWQIGGSADVLIEPAGFDELSRILKIISKNNIPYIVIGDGSNVLFSDEGFRGVVIHMGRAMSDVRIDGEMVRAEAGIAVPRLARAISLAGLGGLEHTVGIPGTLGGLVAMNGGSLRQYIGQVVELVRCLDASGNMIELAGADCEFSYRSSIFLDNPWIITDVVMRLEAGNRAKICRRMLEILRERLSKYPRRHPNCGSVFKSDAALHEKCGPPGWIIEQTGLKGLSVGGAQVSTQHANFIINTGNATAADVLELIRTIRQRVHEKFDVWLECEVRYIHPTGKITPTHLAL